MSISLLTVCRGCGTAYLEFKVVQRDVEALNIKAALSNGNAVPCAMYRVKKDGDATSCVVSVPLIEAESLRLKFFASSTASHPFATKTYSWTYIKWSSRYNYRFHDEKTRFIRDIDNVTYSSQIHVRMRVCFITNDEKELVVKGVVCTPMNVTDPQLSLLGDKAQPIEGKLIMGKVAKAQIQNQDRLEYAYTLRLPNDKKTRCLVAAGFEGTRGGFLCLDPDSVDYYCGICSPHMYRCTEPYGHGARMYMQERFHGAADPVDYALDYEPKFSVVVPLYKTPVDFLNAMVGSVQDQVYQNWELVLANSTPEVKELAEALDKFSDPRIKVVTLQENLGIAGNTNEAIKAATGDYVVFFDHDDTLDSMALFEYANALNEDKDIDALYCDEDFLDEKGEYVSPHYKSDFNIDLLRCHNYITHLLAVRATFVNELMLRPEFDGAQDYDFLLRLVEKTRKFHHVAKILYHWRISDTSTAKSSGNKNYADEAGRKALQEHLDRCGLAAKATLTDSACFYHVEYEVEGEPLVSIVIPNKDSVEVLKRCIDSIFEKTSYKNFEIVICENNSTEDETFAYYKTLEGNDRVKVIVWDGIFNYSAINNYAVKETKGEHLLFLNNDTEVIEPNWLSSMLSFCQREDVGAVGAKLLYPDDTVQHAGVMMIKCNTVNEIGGPIHVFHDIDRDDPGYMRRALLNQDVTVVTAACMMTKRQVFEQLGGFDENFVVAFNDVDLCLRIRDLDKSIVYDADALLYHYESFSRGYETGEKIARFMREQGKLRTAWAQYYVEGDPYHKYACM